MPRPGRFLGMARKNPGFFVPLLFRSREWKVHRENFRSCGTFVPWKIRSLERLLLGSERSKNFRSVEHSFLWTFHSSRVNIPRTFIPWNCCSMRTNIPKTVAPNVLKHDLKLVILTSITSSQPPGAIEKKCAIIFSNWRKGVKYR